MPTLMHWGAAVDWTDPRAWHRGLAPVMPDVIQLYVDLVGEADFAFLRFRRGDVEIYVRHNGIGAFAVEAILPARRLGFVQATPEDPRGVIEGLCADLIAFVDLALAAPRGELPLAGRWI